MATNAPDPDRSELGIPSILGQSDILERWTLTREGLRQRMRNDPDFPKPVGAINGGRNRFWLEEDIADYEWHHPFVLIPRERRRKNKDREFWLDMRSPLLDDDEQWGQSSYWASESLKRAFEERYGASVVAPRNERPSTRPGTPEVDNYDPEQIAVLPNIPIPPMRPTDYLAGDDPDAARAALASWTSGVERTIQDEACRTGRSRNEVIVAHLEAVRTYVRSLAYEPLPDAETNALQLRISAALMDQEHEFRPNADWQDWYVGLLLDERLPFERWLEVQEVLLDRTVRSPARFRTTRSE